MTQVKIDSKIGGGPAAALEPHVPALYAKPGARIMFIGELAHIERTQPAPDTDGQPSVKMRLTTMEIATKEQENAVREAQRALYLQRTAQGTIDDEGEILLAEHTLKMTAGVLSDIELAKLRAGLNHWASYSARAVGTPNITHSELLHELQTVADGLRDVLNRATEG